MTNSRSLRRRIAVAAVSALSVAAASGTMGAPSVDAATSSPAAFASVGMQVDSVTAPAAAGSSGGRCWWLHGKRICT